MEPSPNPPKVDKEPRRQLYLSEAYQKAGGKITSQLLESYRNQVNQLLAKDVKTEMDMHFIHDFMSTIVDLKVSAAETERRGADVPVPSTSGSRSWGQVVRGDEASRMVAQTVKLNELVVIPEKFEGSRSDARRWLDTYERAARGNSWNEATMAKYFQAYLAGPALDWFAVAVQSDTREQYSWSSVRDSFMEFYLGRDEDLELERSLKDSIQKDGESCTSFIARYSRLLLLSEPGASQTKLINAIRIRLRPEIVRMLASHRLTKLSELNSACANIEDGLKAAEAAEKLRRPASSDNTNARKKEQKEEVKTDAKRKRTCHRCDRPGHLKADCFATTKKDGTELRDPPPSKKPKPKVAAATVPEEEEDKPVVVTKRCSVVIANSSIRDHPNLLSHRVKLVGKEVAELKALIDTGSEISLMDAETASLHGFVPAGPVTSLSGANNSPITCHGTVKADLIVRIGNVEKTVKEAKFVVAENLCSEIIVGLEMLRWLKITIDPENMSMAFKPEGQGLRASSNELLEPRSVSVIQVRAPDGLEGSIQTIPFNKGDAGLIVANTIDTVQDGHVSCLVVNVSDGEKFVKAGEILASYELLGEPEEHENFVNATMRVGGSEAFVSVGEGLSQEQIEQLRILLAKYKQAFSLEGELGCTDVMEHDIELLDGAKPHIEPLRRRPVAHQDETRRQVREMLDKGILEESSSPWAAAYVLAKKKSGELRLCIDFRRLNEVTKKCVYPLPNVDSCIETLAGKRYFSQLDMASGFWQLPLSKRARELTAFRTEDGQFQFTRMPFGLTNAPASFQRLVNIVFSGLKGLNLQAFIDDLCIASATWPEHLGILEKVFKLLIDSKLKLKSNKCSFGVDRVIFLGHEISATGIRQDPAKLAAIRDLPEPKDVKELRSALGMLNYYRKFVPSFSILAEPLTRLLKKNVSFVWGPAQSEAFRELIDELLRDGTLIHFDRDAPTAIKTDACKFGIAAILLQQQQDEWRIVTCRSRRLKPNEQNYGITELEALAVVEAVVRLRNYLLGIKFRIITDHCALCAVFKNQSTNGRLNRWRWILSEFDYEIYYTRGRMHADVDCLSRAPIPDEVDDMLDDKVLAIRTLSICATRSAPLATPLEREDWVRLTEGDDEFKRFEIKAKHRRDGFKIADKLLYKNNRLFVPGSKRTRLLEIAHAGEVAVHGGIKATLARLESFWWPRINQDVADFCDACVECQRRKVPRQRPSGEMRSFEASEPWQLVSIDCLDLAESVSHRRHVVVAVDLFTRFVFGKAIKDLKAATFSKFLLQSFGLFGVPKVILTDNAPFFCNSQSEELIKRFDISHRRSTPHHHEGNAVAERMIQTVQEKLSLLANRAQPIDWELAMPQAFLSINTSICASTGFSPYELLFGRPYKSIVEGFEIKDPELNSYLQAQKGRLESVRSRANESQLKSKEQQRRHFESDHMPRSFEAGNKVMVRRKGRLDKLSNRFDGPFEIETRENDIYQLKCEVTGKRIERHVSDMKKFVGAICMLIVVLLVAIEGHFVFDRASPVVWQETGKFVSPGIIVVKVRLAFVNPCGVLLKFGARPEESQAAKDRCDRIYHDNVMDRLARMATEQSGQGAVQKQSNRVPAGPQQNPVVQAPQGYGQPMLPPRGPGQERGKRMVEMVAAFATYEVVNAVVQRFINGFWSQKDGQQALWDRTEELKSFVNKLVDGLNVTMIETQAVARAVENQASLIHHNAADLQRIAYAHPELMVVSAHIVANLVVLGSDLDRLRVSLKGRHVDVDLLGVLAGNEFLEAVEASTISRSSIRATLVDPETIDVAFVARYRDPTTSVYKVEAFEFWSNLTEEEPSLLRYEGPQYLIFNHTIRCAKGISDIHSDWINAWCLEAGYEDPALADWVAVTTAANPWKAKTKASYRDSWPHVYVYCFTHNITIEGATEECPPFVFKVNASTAFLLSTGVPWVPAAIEFHTSVDLADRKVQAVHFRNLTISTSENVALKDLYEARAELKRTQEELYLFTYKGTGVSYFSIMLFGTGLTAALIGTVWYFAREATAVTRSLMTEVYGGAVYERPHVLRPKASGSGLREPIVSSTPGRSLPEIPTVV